jgi:hypothetical protein
MSETPQRHAHSGPGDGGDLSMGATEEVDNGTITIPSAAAGNVATNSVNTNVTDPTVPVILQANPQAGELDSGALFNTLGNALNDGDVAVQLKGYNEPNGAWVIEGTLKGHSEVVIDWVLLA